MHIYRRTRFARLMKQLADELPRRWPIRGKLLGMACQGIVGFEPMRANARERLDELRTGDARPIPERMKAGVRRELERLELLRKQMAEIEAERDALLRPVAAAEPSPLLRLRGIGPEFALALWHEGLYRRFANRRQLATYAGLAPAPGEAAI